MQQINWTNFFKRKKDNFTPTAIQCSYDFDHCPVGFYHGKNDMYKNNFTKFKTINKEVYDMGLDFYTYVVEEPDYQKAKILHDKIQKYKPKKEEKKKPKKGKK